MKSIKSLHPAQIGRIVDNAMAVGREIGHVGGVRLYSAVKAMKEIKHARVDLDTLYDAVRNDIGEGSLNRGHFDKTGQGLHVEADGRAALAGYIELREVWGNDWHHECLRHFVESSQCSNDRALQTPAAWWNMAAIFYTGIKLKRRIWKVSKADIRTACRALADLLDIVRQADAPKVSVVA